MGDASQAIVVVSRSPVSYGSPVSWVRGVHMRGRQNVRHSESCSLYHKHNMYLGKSYQVCGVAHFVHLYYRSGTVNSKSFVGKVFASN